MEVDEGNPLMSKGPWAAARRITKSRKTCCCLLVTILLFASSLLYVVGKGSDPFSTAPETYLEYEDDYKSTEEPAEELEPNALRHEDQPKTKKPDAFEQSFDTKIWDLIANPPDLTEEEVKHVQTHPSFVFVKGAKVGGTTGTSLRYAACVMLQKAD